MIFFFLWFYVIVVFFFFLFGFAIEEYERLHYLSCLVPTLFMGALHFIGSFFFLPQNCTSCLNSVIQRRDNIMHFARQGSSSQACFMRQASTDQVLQTFQSSFCATNVIWVTFCASLSRYLYNVFRLGLLSQVSLSNPPVLQLRALLMPLKDLCFLDLLVCHQTSPMLVLSKVWYKIANYPELSLPSLPGHTEVFVGHANLLPGRKYILLNRVVRNFDI